MNSSQDWWVCVACNKRAKAGRPFGFLPFKRFPLAANCPFCKAQGSMRPERKDSSVKGPAPSVVLRFKISGRLENGTRK